MINRSICSFKLRYMILVFFAVNFQNCKKREASQSSQKQITFGDRSLDTAFIVKLRDDTVVINGCKGLKSLAQDANRRQTECRSNEINLPFPKVVAAVKDKLKSYFANNGSRSTKLSPIVEAALEFESAQRASLLKAMDSIKSEINSKTSPQLVALATDELNRMQLAVDREDKRLAYLKAVKAQYDFIVNFESIDLTSRLRTMLTSKVIEENSYIPNTFWQVEEVESESPSKVGITKIEMDIFLRTRYGTAAPETYNDLVLTDMIYLQFQNAISQLLVDALPKNGEGISESIYPAIGIMRRNQDNLIVAGDVQLRLAIEDFDNPDGDVSDICHAMANSPADCDRKQNTPLLRISQIPCSALFGGPNWKPARLDIITKAIPAIQSWKHFGRVLKGNHLWTPPSTTIENESIGSFSYRLVFGAGWAPDDSKELIGTIIDSTSTKMEFSRRSSLNLAYRICYNKLAH